LFCSCVMDQLVLIILQPHQKFVIVLLFFIMVQGFLVGGLSMKGARKSKPVCFMLNLLGTTHFVVIHLRWLGKCLKRILQKRFGGYRQRWESNLKLQSVPNRNMKGFKMRRFFVGFAMRGRYAWSYFLAGTELYASLVLRSARSVRSAVCQLKSACLYMMFKPH